MPGIILSLLQAYDFGINTSRAKDGKRTLTLKTYFTSILKFIPWLPVKFPHLFCTKGQIFFEPLKEVHAYIGQMQQPWMPFLWAITQGLKITKILKTPKSFNKVFENNLHQVIDQKILSRAQTGKCKNNLGY